MESFLERERAQLPPWFVVGFGCGIAAWFVLDRPGQWAAFLFLSAGVALGGLTSRLGRLERGLGWFGLATMLGCALVWWRAEQVAAPQLARPLVTRFAASVERVEPLPARGDFRLTLAPADPKLPPRVRVSVKGDRPPNGLGTGAKIVVRARLAPPPPMALPGAYDFARQAWFQQIGAVGRALGPVTIVEPVPASGLDAVRDRIGRHIRQQLDGGAGGIATALATGDQNAISEEDAEAMRRSGLAHLLSVSGLHIAAVVGAAMLLTLKLLALSERLALRFNLILVAAAVGALAGIGYTLLTGAQVPTVRSCIAALLVLAGIAMGRDAISLRLVAVGALLILAVRPESLASASFQLSFAAVTAIIALHSTRWARRSFMRRDEGVLARFGRALLGLAATGLVVEFALMPFALYHFHKAGLYGVAANIIAIPLTTFVIMPLEAGALLLDFVGLGAPLWFLAGLTLDALLGLAHAIANAKGAVAMLASLPPSAFALLIGGGLWLCLWTSRARLLGLIPAGTGALLALAAPTPHLLVTGDGRHVALIDPEGTPFMLRDRSGDFTRRLLSESSGYDGDPEVMTDLSSGACSRDSCVAAIRSGNREWRILATRSPQFIDWPALVRACAEADIVVSDRRLPDGCAPRWLKLDRKSLRETGGLAIFLQDTPRVATVAERIGEHPWGW